MWDSFDWFEKANSRNPSDEIQIYVTWKLHQVLKLIRIGHATFDELILVLRPPKDLGGFWVLQKTLIGLAPWQDLRHIGWAYDFQRDVSIETYPVWSWSQGKQETKLLALWCGKNGRTGWAMHNNVPRFPCCCKASQISTIPASKLKFQWITPSMGTKFLGSYSNSIIYLLFGSSLV